jgi:addiction module RelE/StbE family toxin
VSRKAYRVEWADVAGRDLLSIVEYLSERNPDAAASALKKLEESAATLARNPSRGRVVPELSRIQLRDYRELIIRPYRLLYRIAGRRVLVLGIFDSRRSLEDVLLDRLLSET